MSLFKPRKEVDDLISSFRKTLRDAKAIETRDDKEAAKAELTAQLRRQSVERAQRIRNKIEEIFK